MMTGQPPLPSGDKPRPRRGELHLPPRPSPPSAAPPITASRLAEPVSHFPPGTFSHAPLGPPASRPEPSWTRLGQTIDSWADAQVDRSHRTAPAAPTPPPVVIHDPPAPMVASTYRALSWLAAVFIGVPALVTLALMLYQYWAWYNTPFLRAYSAAPIHLGYALGCALVASTIVVACLPRGPWRGESARVAYTAYYAVIAICIMAAGVQLLEMFASVPPDLVGYLTALNLVMASAFFAVLGLALLPFLPTANAYFTRRSLYLQTIVAIRRGELTVERARQLADRPADPPSAVHRPRSLWIAGAVMVAFLGIFVIRNIVQAQTIIRLAESSGDMTVYFGDIPTAPQPAVIISFVVVLVWLTLTLAALSGSNAARTVLTALLVAAIVFSNVAVVAPPVRASRARRDDPRGRASGVVGDHLNPPRDPGRRGADHALRSRHQYVLHTEVSRTERIPGRGRYRRRPGEPGHPATLEAWTVEATREIGESPGPRRGDNAAAGDS